MKWQYQICLWQIKKKYHHCSAAGVGNFNFSPNEEIAQCWGWTKKANWYFINPPIHRLPVFAPLFLFWRHDVVWVFILPDSCVQIVARVAKNVPNVYTMTHSDKSLCVHWAQFFSFLSVGMPTHVVAIRFDQPRRITRAPKSETPDAAGGNLRLAAGSNHPRAMPTWIFIFFRFNFGSFCCQFLATACARSGACFIAAATLVNHERTHIYAQATPIYKTGEC